LKEKGENIRAVVDLQSPTQISMLFFLFLDHQVNFFQILHYPLFIIVYRFGSPDILFQLIASKYA
jgi:hypothetical protein